MPQPYLSRIFIFFKIKAILKFVLLLGLPCLASVREDVPNLSCEFMYQYGLVTGGGVGGAFLSQRRREKGMWEIFYEGVLGGGWCCDQDVK